MKYLKQKQLKGDIADAIINGDLDEITGEYIGPGQGFPRSLSGKDAGTVDALFATKHFLIRMKGFNDQQAETIIRQFGKLKGINIIKRGAVAKSARMIQSDWNEFMKFYHGAYGTGKRADDKMKKIADDILIIQKEGGLK